MEPVPDSLKYGQNARYRVTVEAAVPLAKAAAAR
jgi:hypothetical protein